MRPMRRSEWEVTDYKQMLEFMEACDICRIGMRDGEGVYILPLNFGYQEENGKLVLYFHGAKEGKKIDLLQENPNVSFEMDCKHKMTLANKDVACTYSFSYASIMGHCTVSLITEPEQIREGLQCVMSHYTQRSDWTFLDSAVNRVTVLRLEISDWSCKTR